MAMLLVAGWINMIQSLWKHWFDEPGFHGLPVQLFHFDTMCDFRKSHYQHLAACKPPSLVMLLLVGYINIMQSLLKHRLD